MPCIPSTLTHCSAWPLPAATRPSFRQPTAVQRLPWLLICLTACVLCGSSRSATAAGSTAAAPVDEQARPDEPAQPQEPLTLRVRQLQAAITTSGTQQPLRLYVIVQLELENRSQGHVLLNSHDLALLVNGNAHTCREVSREEQPSSPGDANAPILKPGDTGTCWLHFPDVTVPAEEPSLVLRWKSQADLVLISLTDELRRLRPTESVTQYGLDDCLTLVTTSQQLDVLSIWLLEKPLADMLAAGSRRLAIVPPLGQRPQITRDFCAWLSGWNRRPGLPPADPAATAPAAQDRFLEIHIGGFQLVDRPLGFGGGLQQGTWRSDTDNFGLHETRELAVAAAVRSAYARMDMDRVFADLRHSDAARREAAALACADGLRTEQVTEYLELLHSSAEADRLILLSQLHRVADHRVVPQLLQISQEQNPAISTAALRALTLTADPAATTAVEQLWEVSRENAELQNRLIAAAVASRDYRWCDVLGRYAEDQLRLLTVAQPAAPSPRAAVVPARPLPGVDLPLDHQRHLDDQNDPDRGYAARPLTGLAPPGVDLQQLLHVLNFLKQHRHSQAWETARSCVLQIREPRVQDLVVDFLLQYRSPGPTDWVPEYLSQRLAAGQISNTVRDTALQFPEPRWTAPLLDDVRQYRRQGFRQRKSLAAALRCASSDELDQLLTEYPSLDPLSQSMILNHLAAVDHPRWRALAADALRQGGPLSSEAIDVLHQDLSEESMQILVGQLQQLIDLPVDWESRDAQAVRSLAERLISRVSLLSHPEALRVLNRCYRHRSSQLRARAAGALAAAHRRSPGAGNLQFVRVLKDDQRFEEALQQVEVCIELDQFLPEAYLYRASLLLRMNQLEAAMRDLQRANQLCPEELSTLSTMALVMVRQGDLTGGLQLADQTLQLDPAEESNLYNAACVYGRATEAAGLTDAQKSAYLLRALELLQSSVKAGFADPQHLQQDPDLACLHSEPAWAAVLQAVEDNKSRSREDGGRR